MGSGYLEAIFLDLEALLMELSEQCLAIKKGFSETQRTGAIFASHPVATDLDSILWLRDYASEEEDRDLKEGALRAYFSCVAQFVKMDLLLREEALSQFYREAAVRIGQDRVSLAEMENWLMKEADFHRRQAVIASASLVIKRASSMKRAIWQGREAILKEDFGFESYLDFCQMKKPYDLQSLKRDAEELLHVTEELYRRKVLQWIFRTLGKEPSELSHLHMLRILNADFLGFSMSEGEILKALQDLLEPLGLWGEVGRSIHLDAASRPRKAATSRCVPLKVPQEIHVMLQPDGGLSSLEAALHEMGHALQLAHADPSLPYPYRHLPRSYSLSECFAFLFDGLLGNPMFLMDYLGLSSEEATSQSLEKGLKRLYVVRRYAGNLLFQLLYFSQGEDERDLSSYPVLMGRATGLRYEPEEALMEVEEDLYSADYLRAWAGEVILREHLQSLFGERWYASRDAGQYLKILWASGEKEDLEGLIRKIGSSSLDIRMLSKDLEAILACSSC